MFVESQTQKPDLLFCTVLLLYPPCQWSHPQLLISVARVTDLLEIPSFIFDLIRSCLIVVTLSEFGSDIITVLSFVFYYFHRASFLPLIAFSFCFWFFNSSVFIARQSMPPWGNCGLNFSFLQGTIAFCFHPFCFFISPADNHCPSTFSIVTSTL